MTEDSAALAAIDKQVTAVVATTKEVTKAVDHLTTGIGDVLKTQDVQIAKVKQIHHIMIAVMVSLLVMLVLGFYFIVRIVVNTNEIEKIQETGGAVAIATQREQQTRKDLVFCPMLGALLASYDPSGRVAKADPAQYERTYAGLEIAATHMACQSRVRAGRTTTIEATP